MLNPWVLFVWGHIYPLKNAAFHSMAHRMCNFKLSDENYKDKRKRILEIRTNPWIFKQQHLENNPQA
jgi:hypothetical protein